MEQGIDVVLEDEEVEVDAQTDFLKGDKGDKGDKGNKGDKGDKGDTGEKGDTGYTPVKGIDYYTDNEIQAIIQDITNAIEEKLEPQEQERQSNEQDRITSENTRIEKEIDRQAAELTRISNEEIRQNNENMRETQESEREETENRRMETFAQMEESVANAVNNIVDMTEAYNNNAAQKTNTFNENATEKTNEFNTNVTTKTEQFDTNATNKTTEFNENVETKINEYNANAQAKIDEYNANAEALANRVVELETENEVLKNQIPTGQAEGENITLNDSAEMEFKELKVSGNSWQETRDVTDEDGTVIGAMPSPEFSSEIKNVTGSANITVCNENLFIEENLIKTISTLYQGEEIYNNKNCIKLARVQTTDTDYTHMLNGLKEKTQYTIQLNATLVGNNSDIAFVYSDGSSKTITSGKTSTDFIKITATSEKNKTLTGLRVSCFSWNKYWYIEKGSIQIEEGTVATEYKEHESQQITFPLSEGQRMYKDSYLADDGIHHKREQVVFDGSENWKTSTLIATGYKSYYLENILASFTKNDREMQCNYFKIGTYADWLNLVADNFIENASSGSIGIRIQEDIASDSVTFKNWLAEQYANGTPVTVEYELAEEEIESYTEEQQIVYNKIKKATSYKNITHIFSTDEISPEFDVTYRKDLETLENNKEERLLALENAVLGGN